MAWTKLSKPSDTTTTTTTTVLHAKGKFMGILGLTYPGASQTTTTTTTVSWTKLSKPTGSGWTKLSKPI